MENYLTCHEKTALESWVEWYPTTIVLHGVPSKLFSKAAVRRGYRCAGQAWSDVVNSYFGSHNREIYYFCTILPVLHRTLLGRISVNFPFLIAGIYRHYNCIPQRGAACFRRHSLSSPNSYFGSHNRENYYFCTILLVLHRTLLGRISFISPARIADIYRHYTCIPQKGPTRCIMSDQYECAVFVPLSCW